MPAAFRPPLEIWGALQAAGGARLALIPECLDAEEAKALDGHDLTVDLPLGFGASGQVQEGRVLRTVWRDGSYDEWRIKAVRVERKPTGALVARLDAQDPRVALGDVLVTRTEADGTHTYTFSQTLPASEHLAKFILPALAAEGYTWVAAGTITPTQPIEVAYDYTTALAAVQALAEALSVEFDFRRNGTSQYLIDLVTQIGASATALQVRYSRNLTGFAKIPDGGEIATRVVPRGADEGGIRATCAEAQWQVTAVDTGLDDVTLADPLGGAGPVLEDDQLNGYYLERPSGTRDQIVDTFAATQKLRVADASVYAVNDLVKLRRTSGGERLDFVPSPLYGQAPPTGYGLRTKVLDRPDLAGTVNLLANPAMRTYSVASNAAPDNWRVIPGCGLAVANVDKETSAAFWRVGGQSAKVVTGGDGQGIETDYAVLTPSDASPYVSGFGGFWNDTNGARIRTAIILGLAPVSISSMSRTAPSGSTPGSLTVNTGAAHGLAVGDLVEILGVTGATIADGPNGVKTVSRVVDSDTFEYQFSADPGAPTPSGATMRKVWRFQTTGNPASKTWVDYGVEGLNAKELAAVAVKVQVLQEGSTGATVYVDRGQLTQTATQRAFLEGNGQTRLWQEATAYLRSHRQPPTRYEVSLLDLGRIDPTRWPYDDVVLGGTVVVADPDAPLAITTRIVGVKRKPLVDGDTTIELSTKFEDLTDHLARPPRPPALTPAPPGRRRRVYPVRIGGAKMLPTSSAQFNNLTYPIGASGVSNSGAAHGSVKASLSENKEFIGATIVGFRAKGTLTGGQIDLNLYRDSTILAPISLHTTDPDKAVMTLRELVASTSEYWVYADLGAGAGNTVTLEYVDIFIEVDDQ